MLSFGLRGSNSSPPEKSSSASRTEGWRSMALRPHCSERLQLRRPYKTVRLSSNSKSRASMTFRLTVPQESPATVLCMGFRRAPSVRINPHSPQCTEADSLGNARSLNTAFANATMLWLGFDFQDGHCKVIFGSMQHPGHFPDGSLEALFTNVLGFKHSATISFTKHASSTVTGILPTWRLCKHLCKPHEPQQHVI